METGHVGEVLDGRYRLRSLLGKGGMGEVYLGEHVGIGKEVAVKLLLPSFAQNGRIIERFHREARAAAAIRHPNIIDVLDVGMTPSGAPYMVLEYLRGTSLGTLLAERGALSLPAAVAICTQVLDALGAAHGAGIVHRDLKPDNVFLCVDAAGHPLVKLIDFGISKVKYEGGDHRLTAEGSVLGTPTYMAPEQARGEKGVDHRVDLYACGVMLYEMLTGRLPFSGDNYNAIIISVLTEAVPDPRQTISGFPVTAWPVIERALVKRPDERFGTAAELAGAVGALCESAETQRALRSLLPGLSGSEGAAQMAMGDLGADTRAVDDDDFLPDETIDAWSRAHPEKPDGRGRTLALAGVMALLVGALLVAGVGMLIGNRGSAPVHVIKPMTTGALNSARGVKISLEGVPAGARVYYREMLISQNPFRVEKGETITPIRVSADGYRDFNLGIVPSMDRTIQVELVPDKVPSLKQISKSKKKRTRVASQAAKPVKPSVQKGSLASLTPQQTDPVYQQKKGALVACYNRALSAGVAEKNKGLAVKLRLTIKPSGVVGAASLAGLPAGHESLGACVRTEAKTWLFPKSASGGKASYPIYFTTRE